MAGENRLELVVEVNAAAGNAAIEGVNKNLSIFEKSAVDSSRRASGGFDNWAASLGRSNTALYQGRESAMLLSEEIGVRMPRAVSRFLAQSDLIGPALRSAFEASVFISMGVGLTKLIEKFPVLLDTVEDFTLGLGESRAELVKDSAEMVKLGEHARDLRNELSLIGLSGMPKLTQESEIAAGALSDAQRQANVLKNTWESLSKARQEQEAKVQYQRQHAIAGGMEIGPGIQMGLNALFGVSQKDVDAAFKAWQLEQDKVRQLTVTTVQAKSKVNEEGNKQEIEAAKEVRKANLASYEEIVAAHIDASTREYNMLKKDNEAQDALEKKAHDDAIASWEEVAAAHVAAADRDVEQIRKEAKAVEDLQSSNLSVRESILRGRKDYAGVAQFEIDALDQEKAKYAGNADAIAAIEERKKLLIEQSNMEIAKDAETQFARSTATIETFFDRVFAHAKSFADIWKSLWSQAVGYVEKQFAHLAATMVMGRNAAPAPAGGGGAGGAPGGGGGILGAIGAITGIGTGFGFGTQRATTPEEALAASLPSVGGLATGEARALAGAGGSKGGILGMLGGGGAGDLLGNLKKFVGLGAGRQSAHLQDVLKSGGKIPLKDTLSDIGHSNAALLGGGLLAFEGLKRGGASGLAMTTAGGAMIGFKFGGPLGAAIGAAAGAIAGTARLFIKGAVEQARDKIKATYGVDIQDKKVLQQIVDIAKQSYGSNLDMAIRTSQVSDLVRLYGMSTGQGTGRIAAPMIPTTIMESGGSLTQAQQYYGGTPQAMPGGLRVTVPSYQVGTDFVPRDTLAFLHRGEGVTPASENKALPSSDLGGSGRRSGGDGGGGGAGGPMTVHIQLDGPATTSLLRGEALQAIVRNPQVVQSAALQAIAKNPRVVTASVVKAMRGSAGRQEIAGMVNGPFTLTSSTRVSHGGAGYYDNPSALQTP